MRDKHHASRQVFSCLGPPCNTPVRFPAARLPFVPTNRQPGHGDIPLTVRLASTGSSTYPRREACHNLNYSYCKKNSAVEPGPYPAAGRYSPMKTPGLMNRPGVFMYRGTSRERSERVKNSTAVANVSLDVCAAGTRRRWVIFSHALSA